MRKIKRYSHTVFKQLVLFTVITSILPISAISLWLFNRINGLEEQERMNSYSQIASQYTEVVREKLTQYENSAFFISKNTIIMEQLENKDTEVNNRGGVISEEVFKYLLPEVQNTVRNCMVYSKQQNIPIYGRSAAMWETAQKESWYPYYNGEPGKWFFFPEPYAPDVNVASILYDIQKVDFKTFEMKDLGIVKLDINMKRLFAPVFLNKDSVGYRVIVYDDNKRILYTNSDESMEQKLAYLEAAEQNESLRNGKVVKFFKQVAAYSQLEKSRLNILLLFDNHLIDTKQQVQRLMASVIFLVICIVTVSAWLFARRFSKRVNMLVNKFKVVETGNLEITEAIPGRDEIAVLDEWFSHMLKKLKELIRKNYIQELDRKETELQNLQLQINPHFLYNTLETISSIAAVKQVFMVCDICEKLGDIFRYSLGKNYGDFVTVDQEIHHVQNYIFIQKLRYGNKFEVFYYIEPEVKNCMVLRFILQPIVENAIIHGIGPMTGRGTLEITVSRQEKFLVVKIEDDGVGMTESKKATLVEYMNSKTFKKEEKKSIGVRNVNQRVKLTFGEMYGVQIKSAPYRGSSFLITFPLEEQK